MSREGVEFVLACREAVIVHAVHDLINPVMPTKDSVVSGHENAITIFSVVDQGDKLRSPALIFSPQLRPSTGVVPATT